MQGRSFALLKHSWFAPGLGPTMRRSLLTVATNKIGKRDCHD